MCFVNLSDTNNMDLTRSPTIVFCVHFCLWSLSFTLLHVYSLVLSACTLSPSIHHVQSGEFLLCGVFEFFCNSHRSDLIFCSVRLIQTLLRPTCCTCSLSVRPIDLGHWSTTQTESVDCRPVLVRFLLYTGFEVWDPHAMEVNVFHLDCFVAERNQDFVNGFTLLMQIWCSYAH